MDVPRPPGRADAERLTSLLGCILARRWLLERRGGGPEAFGPADAIAAALDRDADRRVLVVHSGAAVPGTVVLDRHFMDVVEELCDRVAVVDRGGIVALDTPAGLIDGVDADHQMRFTLMDDETRDPAALLGDLPGVTGVVRDGKRVTVTGRGDFATAVTSVLARELIPVADLRIDKRTHDDAFVALTGRSFHL